jgi:hypothetical protein
MTIIDDDYKRELDRIRKLPWTAQFHKTLENKSVPGGFVDMYVLLDDDSGETLVTLAVPKGFHALAEYVAGCCADPFFVRLRVLSRRLSEVRSDGGLGLDRDDIARSRARRMEMRRRNQQRRCCARDDVRATEGQDRTA